MKLQLLLLFVISFGYISAQNPTQPVKSHFAVLNFHNENELSRAQSAGEKFFEFDQFRFLDSRRQIHIKNTDIIIELFSANELETIYGKLISPLTIMPGQDYLEIELDFVDSKEPLFVIVYTTEN